MITDMSDPECADCMSDAITASDCDPECPLSDDHVHLHCPECDYEWTERT